jgi:hypothetical protein
MISCLWGYGRSARIIRSQRDREDDAIFLAGDPCAVSNATHVLHQEDRSHRKTPRSAIASGHLVLSPDRHENLPPRRRMWLSATQVVGAPILLLAETPLRAGAQPDEQQNRGAIPGFESCQSSQ